MTEPRDEDTTTGFSGTPPIVPANEPAALAGDPEAPLTESTSTTESAAEPAPRPPAAPAVETWNQPAQPAPPVETWNQPAQPAPPAPVAPAAPPYPTAVDTQQWAPSPPPQPTYEQPNYQQPNYQQQQPTYQQAPTYPQQPGQPYAQQPPAYGQPTYPPPGYTPPAGYPAQQWAQPQQAWPQPPPGQQYWAQGQAAMYRHGTSVLAVIAGVFLLIFGLLWTFVGAVIAIIGQSLARLVDIINQYAAQNGGTLVTAADLEPAKPFILGGGIVVAVIGILMILGAFGIWAHKGWGRAIGVLFGVLGTLLGVLFLLGSLQPMNTVLDNGSKVQVSGLPFAVAWLLISGLILVAMLFGGKHFTRYRVQ